MCQTRLIAYHQSAETFRVTEGPGYFVSYEPVIPLRVEPVGDLLARLVAQGVEVRLVPSLWPLDHALLSATLHYSMIRMRNTQTEGAQATVKRL